MDEEQEVEVDNKFRGYLKEASDREIIRQEFKRLNKKWYVDYETPFETIEPKKDEDGKFLTSRKEPIKVYRAHYVDNSKYPPEFLRDIRKTHR
jgi:hypothetical protein